MLDLAALGWDEAWEAAFEPYRRQGLLPGRVAIPHREACDVLTEEGEVRALLPGRLRRDARAGVELPAVGDWVALERRGDAAALIRAVLPRRTRFVRRVPHDRGRGEREQVVAANVDVVFVTLPFPGELDARQLERYLALAWESGARPVVLLTKADLADAPEQAVARVRTLDPDVPAHAVSARTGEGLEAVRASLRPGITGALLGPSGAGKSTLVNALAGEALLETGEVGRRGAGRHVTTRRQLVPLPGGGLLIDNPGMRGLHLPADRALLAEAFPDVEELAARCRFSDCRHDSEPGCAVREALAQGLLAPERLSSYRSLEREIEELERAVAARRPRPRRGGARAGGR